MIRRLAMTHCITTLVGVAGCVTGAPPPRVSWGDVATVPPRAARSQATGSLLWRTTDALLDAIERETGERPLFDDDAVLEPATTPREARKHSTGWTEERTDLAAELVRSLDAGGVGQRAVLRARAALRWDVMLGARWTEVDRRIVADALKRADDALPKPPPPPKPVEPELEWPLSPVRVTSAFGARIDPFGEGARIHTGVDLAAVEGQSVFAVADGTVIFVGNRGGYGINVELRHPDGLVSRYAHLSGAAVRTGARVRQGGLVGRAGKTGRATGPHLHLEVWRDGAPIDPEDDLPPKAMLSRD